MATVEELANRVLDKQLEIERLEHFATKRRQDLEAEMNAIQELEAVMGTGSHTTLRELGKEVAPEDYLDMVNRLENKLKLQQMRYASIQKEYNEAALLDRQTEDQIEQISAEEARIKAITGYNRQHVTSPNHICSKLSIGEQDGLLVELNLLVAKIREELRVMADIIIQKDKAVSHLLKAEVEMDEQEERRYELRSKVNAQNNLLRSVAEEYEGSRKEHLKADKIITKLESQNDTGCLSSLMQDKVFLKAKIYEHVDMRRTQDKVIKAQSFRLTQLNYRADMIANAVADLKMKDLVSSKLKGAIAPIEEPVCSLDIETILPSDETVDVALYELLARDVEAIENSIDLKNIILLEKEATIEALEEKVERVLYLNEEDMLQKNEDVQALENEVRSLNQEVWNDRDTYQHEISELRKQKAVVQKRVASARKHKKKIEKERA